LEELSAEAAENLADMGPDLAGDVFPQELFSASR